MSPPGLPVFGDWEDAAGIVVNFSFSPRFFEAMAKKVRLLEVVSDPQWHHFFAIDQRTEALCRLLMEETEDQCPAWSALFRAACPRIDVAHAWHCKEATTENGCSA